MTEAIEALEHVIAVSFSRLGDFLGRRPLSVIGSVILLTAVMSLGLLRFEEVNNVRTEYSPINAPSRIEYEVAKNFLRQNGTMDPIYVMVEAKDGGSLLRPEYRKVLTAFAKRMQHNVTVDYRGRTYAYTDLCEPYCEMNTAFLAFLKLYDPKNPVTYTYPAIELFGAQAFIGNNAYGIKLKSGTKQLESFSTAILQFFIVAPEGQQELLLMWVAEAKAFLHDDDFKILKIGMTGDILVSAEVRRMGFETAPMLIGSIIAMIVFVVGSSFRRNPAKSKPWESLVGCLIPILALITSTSIISAFGLKFQSIVVASLFLVLSVGVDDVFIILRAWDGTNMHSPVHERLAKTLEDAGPSITISSLTNALAFAIGILSKTPAVRTFSIYSCIAVIVCYFYQLILFTAVLALSGKRELKGYQSLLCCLKADPSAQNRIIEFFCDIQSLIIKNWSTFISSWPARFVLFFFMMGYYYISVLGARRLEANISTDKMALPDSYLHEFQHVFEAALRNMQPITVFVMRPGDLRDPVRLQAIKSMVYEFEHSAFSYGNESTFFWLQQYEDFLEFYEGTDEFTYKEIPTFFKSAAYFFLSSFVRMNETACYDDDPECISAFFFITNFHDVIKYHELIPAVLDWRRIAAKYSDFDVYPYSDHSPFVDQTMTIESTVLWSVIAALGCTAAACFVFIPNIVSIICAVYSVFSISVGVFGLLSHWGVDLDPLSMAALLMAIGCSVDFTAHISYHYYKAIGKSSRDRLENALTRIGWPITQVGLSTIVALLPLFFKQSYLALVFLKTVVVVVLLGMFHGLVVLPAILTAITGDNAGSEKSSEASSERSSQRSRERDSFYKTQKLINRLNKKITLPNDWKRQKSTNERRKSHDSNKVAPLSALDLAPRSPVAYVHKIELGRTPSSQFP